VTQSRVPVDRRSDTARRRFLRAPSMAALGLGVAFACACSAQEEVAGSSQDPLNAGQPSASALFAPTTKRVVLEIDYAPGAEPYAASATTFPDRWKIFRDNARAVLGGKVEIVIPEELAEMERLEYVDATVFDRNDLLAIAQKHRGTVSGGDTLSFYVLFLDGRFKDDEGRVLDRTVGISVRGTGIIAMFKPAITADFVQPVMPMFMEQVTLVHEFGHAIGLVGERIPTTSPHRDDARGAHCRNPSCIMYWKNDMVKEGVDFVGTFLAPRNGVLFGPECLADAHALAARQGVDLASLVGHPSVASTAEPATLIIDE
jgi:hypothetical protein